ncbi:MAG: hypothetical protein AAFN04_14815 [Pseudomonadota bacterium]
MLGEVLMFGCEPNVPYQDDEPWVVSISEIHETGKAAIGQVSPRVKAPFGRLEGERIETFVFTPRHLGGRIEMAFEDYVVAYFHPFLDEESPSLIGLNEEIPSTGMPSALGYCILANPDTAKNKFKLELGVV